MSHLLLVRGSGEGPLEVLLADEELADGADRVFRRGEDVVLRVRPGDTVVVRDVRRRVGIC